VNRALTPAEERLLASIEGRPEVREEILNDLAEAFEDARAAVTNDDRHVIWDVRWRKGTIRDAQVGTRRRSGSRIGG